MQILPLKFIREEDKKSVGTNLFNLAKLNHLGVPVVEAVVALPPNDVFKKIIEKHLKHNEDLVNSENFKQEFLKLEIPEALKTFQIAEVSKSNQNLNVNIPLLWENLLSKWFSELISKVERKDKKVLDFTPQLVIFSSNFTALGKGFFDEDRGHVTLEVDQGQLDFEKSEKIEKIILLANKKLLIHQIYYWVIEDGEPKIIKLSPFTQSLKEVAKKIDKPIEVVTKRPNPKTATKVFLDFKDENLEEINCDGIIIKIQDLDIEKINVQLEKSLSYKKDLKIIFAPDFGQDKLKNLEFAKIFLFFKNKKKLDVSILLPQVFSKDEYLSLKTDFASLGIYSKGSLKLWKTFSTVQDFLNLDDYLDAGFDGAVIDLDSITEIVTGVDAEIILNEPKIDWISSIEKFFKELGLNKIIKNHKQVLITGLLAQNEELLHFFIKSGVWGISYQKNSVNNFKEHISFIEKQTIKKLPYSEVKH